MGEFELAIGVRRNDRRHAPETGQSWRQGKPAKTADQNRMTGGLDDDSYSFLVARQVIWGSRHPLNLPMPQKNRLIRPRVSC